MSSFMQDRTRPVSFCRLKTTQRSRSRANLHRSFHRSLNFVELERPGAGAGRVPCARSHRAHYHDCVPSLARDDPALTHSVAFNKGSSCIAFRHSPWFLHRFRRSQQGTWFGHSQQGSTHHALYSVTRYDPFIDSMTLNKGHNVMYSVTLNKDSLTIDYVTQQDFLSAPKNIPLNRACQFSSPRPNDFRQFWSWKRRQNETKNGAHARFEPGTLKSLQKFSFFLAGHQKCLKTSTWICGQEDRWRTRAKTRPDTHCPRSSVFRNKSAFWVFLGLWAFFDVQNMESTRYGTL